MIGIPMPFRGALRDEGGRLRGNVHGTIKKTVEQVGVFVNDRTVTGWSGIMYPLDFAPEDDDCGGTFRLETDGGFRIMVLVCRVESVAARTPKVAMMFKSLGAPLADDAPPVRAPLLFP